MFGVLGFKGLGFGKVGFGAEGKLPKEFKPTRLPRVPISSTCPSWWRFNFMLDGFAVISCLLLVIKPSAWGLKGFKIRYH